MKANYKLCLAGWCLYVWAFLGSAAMGMVAADSTCPRAALAVVLAVVLAGWLSAGVMMDQRRSAETPLREGGEHD